MNRPGDIDDVLEAWFLDGPMAMPDRLFEAVLDGVERAPQRRLARLHLRLTDMSPQLRIVTAAAVVLVVAGIGVGVLNRAGGSGPGASAPTTAPSPSATPSPSSPAAAGSVPAALQKPWIGGPRDVPGLDPHSSLAGTRVVFGPDSFAVTRSNQWGDEQLRSVASATGPDVVRLETQASSLSCRVGDAGTYRWSVSAEGTKLMLEAIGDDCAARASAAAGTWLLVACPAADDGCLGPLSPGRYPSQYIDPFIGPGESWSPRYNAISYQVPAGWTNTSDWPSEYTLRPQAGADDRGIWTWGQIAIVSEQKPCEQDVDPTVSPSAVAMADYLSHAPGLVATSPAPVTIGGLSGFRMDVSMDPAWTATCPFSNGQPTRMIFTDRSPGDGLHWGLGPDTQMRLWILDLGNAGAMVVDLEAATKADYDAIADEGTAIVESLQVSR